MNLFKLSKNSTASLKFISKSKIFNAQYRGFLTDNLHTTKKLLTKKGLLNSNLDRTILINQARYESNSTDAEKTTLISDSMANSSFGQNQLGFIADSPITRFAENILIDLHNIACLEWSTTIFAAALMFRMFVCFPIKIYQERLMAKLLNIQPIINDLIKKSRVNKKVSSNSGKKKIMNNQEIRIRNEIYKKEGCLPQKIPISSFVQLPFWIYLTTSIRDLTFGKYGHSIPMEQITNESFLWISSLATVDPYYILPICYAAFALGSIKYASLNSISNKNVMKIFSFRKYLTMVFIGVITILISKMPASVALFWIFSNSLGFLEILILDSIRMKRLFKIPITEIEPKNIYSQKYSVVTRKLAYNLKWFKSLTK